MADTLSFIDELSLLVATRGVPPEMLQGAVEFLGEIRELVETGVGRNLSMEILAKVQAAKLMRDMSAQNVAVARGMGAGQGELVDAVRAQGSILDAMSVQLLDEVRDLLEDDEDDGPKLSVVPAPSPDPLTVVPTPEEPPQNTA